MRVEDFFPPQIVQLLKDTVNEKGFEVSLNVGELLDIYVINNVCNNLVINPLPLWSGDGALYEYHVHGVTSLIFHSEKYNCGYISRYIYFPEEEGYDIVERNDVIGVRKYQPLNEGGKYTITCDSGSMVLDTEVVVLNNKLHVLKIYQDGNLIKSYEHCLVEAVVCDYNSGYEVGATELVPVSNATWCSIQKIWKKYI